MERMNQGVAVAVSAVTLVFLWSTLIWFDYDIRDWLRTKKWMNTFLSGVPFRLIYGLSYVMAFALVIVIHSLLVSLVVTD